MWNRNKPQPGYGNNVPRLRNTFNHIFIIHDIPKYTTGAVTYYVSKFLVIFKPPLPVSIQRPPPPP